MSRWRPLHLARLDWTWIASLTRISPWIHFLDMTWSSRSFWSLLIEIHMIWLRLKLILFMEWILTNLFILRIKAIEIMISLMEEINHSWSHATTPSITSRSLIKLITCTILRNKLLNISLSLSWLIITSSRYTWKMISKHRCLTKAICLIISSSLWPRII